MSSAKQNIKVIFLLYGQFLVILASSIENIVIRIFAWKA
jgi:hypothetical protein